ncbi:M20 family metallopeptidase [Cryobacterium sp. Y50]|uniref:M20 family metallopeptidase n=1 Tax=Cryobacterium sp. Y50 TaxID=2048286 RepID=UPI0018EDF3F2|nr:M20 family metallopeptidase [Cryobacterium sp. Y50]
MTRDRAHDWIDTNRSNLVADLAEYIDHETPSDDPELLQQGLAWIEGWLTALIGAPVERQAFSTSGFGDTVVWDLPPTEGSHKSVSVLCHYDTVWDAGTLTNWPVAIDGDRLTGPGAFDMKGGLIQFAWAVAALKACGLPNPAIRLVLNGDEEVGSPSSRQIIERAVSGGGPVLVFESAANGAVKTARKGVGIFTIDVTGIEAHAGLDPLAGTSAIDEIARIVLKLHSASDHALGTTLNVGTISGGSRTNVTAGHATAELDVRVTSNSEANRIDAVLGGLTTADSRATVAITGGWNRPVMERSAATGELFKVAYSTAAVLGFELREVSVGGASDGNFAAALGLPVLDGLGPVGSGAHARHEWISIDGMVERTALAAGLLVALA